MTIQFIAEIGVNHNGDLELAKAMTAAAISAGADIVKFQVAIPSEVVTASAPQADYQKINMGGSATQLQMIQDLMLSHAEFRELFDWCDENAFSWSATAFDRASLELIEGYSIPFHKIPSGEVSNLPYVGLVARSSKPILLSTGMCNLADIDEALRVIAAERGGIDDVTLLQCTSNYPVSAEDVNLRVIKTLHDTFGVQVGFSDHTEGVVAALGAIALGASLIEKHFTLDRSLPGPDQVASATPVVFEELVKAGRYLEVAMGSPFKAITPSEMSTRKVATRSIVAARDIRVGERFTKENLAVKRPGGGISPKHLDVLVNLRASKDFLQDDLIEW